MRLEDAFKRVKEDLAGDPTSVKVCLAFLDCVAKHSPDQFKRVTYGMVCKIASCEQADEVLPAVAYLIGDRLPILKPRFSFIDDTHDEILDDEQMRLLLQGAPYQDERGERFASPLEHVYTHFELTTDALRMHEQEHGK